MNTEPEELLPASNVEPDEAVSATPPELTPRQIAFAVLREVAETVLLALVMVFVLQLVIKNFRVEGHSMDPNLQHGQYLVVDKLSYRLPFNVRPPRRGDVIVFVPPSQPTKDFVKRIIALPGETVELRQGIVFIDSVPLSNTFGANLDRSSMAAMVVPENAYFVLGDNRPNSNDSRSWGMLAAEKVVGKTWLSYWPPAAWGIIPANRPARDAMLSHWLSRWLPKDESVP